MELLFDHSFGKQEQQDLVICRPYCIAEPHEEDRMLESGWLCLDTPLKPHREVWYQSRSTRVDLRRNKKRFKDHHINSSQINMMHIRPRTPDDTVWTGMHEIYQKYIKAKGFKDMYSPFQQISARDSFLVYYTGQNPKDLIGFTKIKKYWMTDDLDHEDHLFPEHQMDYVNNLLLGVESVLHCNLLPISQITMDMEIQWAKSKKASHFYMGSGYEKSSQYKAHWTGFEWWTGTEWSNNKRKYLGLCKRDSELKLISDLAR